MILIEPDAYVPRSALPKRELSRFLAQACGCVGVEGQVTVLMTTDERMRELNRTFRRKNKPTDVLSFPPAPAVFAGQAAGGDLAISLDTALYQARSLGHPLLIEVKILMLHGLLHLSGMDHEQDAGQMARRESRLRRKFGLPVGLIQRTVAAGRSKTTLPGPAPRQKRTASMRARKSSAKALEQAPGPVRTQKRSPTAGRATAGAAKAGAR